MSLPASDIEEPSIPVVDKQVDNWRRSAAATLLAQAAALAGVGATADAQALHERSPGSSAAERIN